MLLRQIAIRSIRFILSFFVIATVTHAQEPKTFRVDSYIPERFEDLEWRLSGETRYLNSYSRPEDGQRSDFRPLSDTRSRATDVDVSSLVQYRHQTRQREFLFSALLETEYAHRANERMFDYRSGGYVARDFQSREDQTSTYKFGASSFGELLQYLSGRVFGTARVTGAWSYSHLPKERYFEVSFDSTGLYGDASVTRYQRRDAAGRAVGHNNRIGGEVALGMGRMYTGAYAATALFFIEELRKNGLLAAVPTYEQMVSLTDTVYRYRQAHAIDYRLHRQKALAAIVSLLLEQRVLDSLDAKTPYLLQDIWDYYSSNTTYSVQNYLAGHDYLYPYIDNPRQFGARIRVGFAGTYQYVSANTSRVTTSTFLQKEWVEGSPDTTIASYESIDDASTWRRQQVYNKSLFMYAEYSRPFGLRWQFDCVARYDYGLDPWTDDYFVTYQYDPTRRSNYWQRHRQDDRQTLYGRILFRYLYDSRTFVTIGSQVVYSKLAWYTERRNPFGTWYRIEGHEEEETGFRHWANITYRISIPTSVNLGISYLRNSDVVASPNGYDSSNDGRQFVVEFGFNHSVF